MGCNLGPKFPPHVGRSAKKMTAVLSMYKWTKISDLEIDNFGLKMLVKNVLDFSF